MSENAFSQEEKLRPPRVSEKKGATNRTGEKTRTVQKRSLLLSGGKEGKNFGGGGHAPEKVGKENKTIASRGRNCS